MKHVRLSTITTKDVNSVAVKAADAIADAGGSPKAQIEAAREATGERRLGYISHQGAKQRERALKRMEKQEAKKIAPDLSTKR